MSSDASVATGPELSPEEEADYRRQQTETLADQTDSEVKAIEEKLAGWTQTLKDKKAEAKRLRAELKEARG
jgi:hypothetical protein